MAQMVATQTAEAPAVDIAAAAAETVEPVAAGIAAASLQALAAFVAEGAAEFPGRALEV
jgi:hypothetical protein